MLHLVPASVPPALVDPAPLALLSTPLGRLLVAIVVLAGVVLVGRILLNLAWKLLIVAGVVVGILYLLSLVGI